VKERARAIVKTLPFDILPHRLIVEIVYNTIFWLNCFPHKEGIHPTLSLHTIVTGSKIDYNKHCKIQFREYVQVHKQHNNSMLPRMSGAITLHRTGNAQGSYYFLSLHSGKQIVRNNWTALPIPAEVITTVHQLAKACKKYKGIVFTDKDGNIINDDNDPKQGNIEITGVNDDNEDDVDDDENEDTTGDDDITGVENQDITGVHQNIINEENVTEAHNTKVHEDVQNYKQTEHDDVNAD